MLLAGKDEARHRMSVQDELGGHSVMLTVVILSATVLNFSNALRNVEIQSTRAVKLSVPPRADATLWTGPVTELALFSASQAASMVAISGVPSCDIGGLLALLSGIGC